MAVLKTVKETFNIHNDGRKHNPIPQKFMLAALQEVFGASETKERIGLREAVGYFGHGLREMTGKIRPREVEMIERNGKITAVNLVPAVRTKSVNVDSSGNVVHEQEFLDTETGRAALAVYESGSGGFSWAMSGSNGHHTQQGSVARKFAGFDFVMQPNFIPLHRQDALFSSVGCDNSAMLLSSIQDSGVESERAGELFAQYSVSSEDNSMSELLLSQMIAERQNRDDMLLNVIEGSDYFITEKQRDALLSCQTPEDLNEISALFSAISRTDVNKVPVTPFKRERVATGRVSIEYPAFDEVPA